MLFIPEKKAKELRRKVHAESVELIEKQTLKRREEYLKAKENGTLDEYFENLKKSYL